MNLKSRLTFYLYPFTSYAFSGQLCWFSISFLDGPNATDDLYTLPIKRDYKKPHQQPVGLENSCPPLPNRKPQGRHEDILRPHSVPNDTNVSVHHETLPNNDHRAGPATEHSDSGSPNPPLPPKPRSSDPQNYCRGPLDYLEVDCQSREFIKPIPTKSKKPHVPVTEHKKKLIPPPPEKSGT